MIVSKSLYRIRVNIKDIKRVLEIHNTLEKPLFIEAKPAGIFSGSADIIYENGLLHHVLEGKFIPFREKSKISRLCVITGNNEVKFETKEDRINALAAKVEKIAERLVIVEKEINKEVDINQLKMKIAKDIVSVLDSVTVIQPADQK